MTDTGVGIPPEVLLTGDGAALFNQSPRTGVGACDLAINRGKESGAASGGQRAWPGQRIHDPIDRRNCRWRIAVTQQNGARILVVDDDPDICRNLSDILTDLGFQVDCAQDGLAALELVAPAALRRGALGSEDARHGRANALPRNQEATRRDGVDPGDGLCRRRLPRKKRFRPVRGKSFPSRWIFASCFRWWTRPRAAAGADRRRRSGPVRQPLGPASRTRVPGEPGAWRPESGRAAQEHGFQGRAHRHADSRRGWIGRVSDGPRGQSPGSHRS